MSNLSDPKMIDNWVRVLGGMIERGEALHDLFPVDEVNAYSTAQFDAIASKLGLTKSMVMLAHKAAPQGNNKESSPPIAAGAASPSVAVQPHVAPVIPPSVDSKVAGWDHMTEDEKAGMFINWLNAKMNATRPPDRVKVAIIHEVAYKFQMTNNMALKVRHLNNVRRPRSYVDMGIQVFTEGSGYLGFTIRMT